MRRRRASDDQGNGVKVPVQLEQDQHDPDGRPEGGQQVDQQDQREDHCIVPSRGRHSSPRSAGWAAGAPR